MIERAHVLICSGSNCISRGAKSLRDEFEDNLNRLGIRDEIKLVNTGCVGLCEQGPFVIVYPEGVFYSTVKNRDIKTICEEHLYKGRIVEKLVFDEAIDEDHSVKAFDEIKFYAKQTRVAIRNCGLINPDDIEEYIAKDGYRGLGKALIEMTPIEVVEEMIASGLRGRGGGGFSTGIKWRFAHNNENDQKYIICNADEGDPGAFMDRALLEGDPHSILEGMMIAGYAIGADKGYVYVRIEYPTAIEKLKVAIGQAQEYGLLGKNIFGTYPLMHLENNPLLTSGRGNVIPQVSTDEYFAELALWFGLPPGNLTDVLHNMGNFYSYNPSQMPLGFMQF